MMKARHRFTRKIVSILLILVMLSSTGFPAFAKTAEFSGGEESGQTATADSAIMDFLKDEYGADQAPEMYDTLQKFGLINQEGNIDQLPIQLDGKDYTLDETKDLLDDSGTDLDQIAKVDGQEISLESLRKIIEIEAELSNLVELQDTSDVHITKDHLDYLESMIDQAGTEGFSTLANDANEADEGEDESFEDYVYATVTNIQLDIVNDAWDRYNQQMVRPSLDTYGTFRMTFELNREVDQDVSFDYEVIGGAQGGLVDFVEDNDDAGPGISAEAKESMTDGTLERYITDTTSGTVVFPAGETKVTLEMKKTGETLKDLLDFRGSDSSNSSSDDNKQLLQNFWMNFAKGDYLHFHNFKNMDAIRFAANLRLDEFYDNDDWINGNAQSDHSTLGDRSQNRYYYPFVHTYDSGAYLAFSNHRETIYQSFGQQRRFDLFKNGEESGAFSASDDPEILEVQAKPGQYTTGQIVPMIAKFNRPMAGGLYPIDEEVPSHMNDNYLDNFRKSTVLELANGDVAAPEFLGSADSAAYYLPHYKTTLIASPPRYSMLVQMASLSSVFGFNAIVKPGSKPEDLFVKSANKMVDGFVYDAWDNWHEKIEKSYFEARTINEIKWGDGNGNEDFSNHPDIHILPARAEAFATLEVDNTDYKIGDTIKFTIKLDTETDGASDWLVNDVKETEDFDKRIRLSIGDREKGLVENLHWKESPEDPEAEGSIIEGTMEVTEHTLDLVTSGHQEDGALRAKIYYNQGDVGDFENKTENFILLQDQFAPFHLYEPIYIEQDDLEIVYPGEWPSGEKKQVSLIDSTPTRLGYTYPEDKNYTEPDRYEWTSSNDRVAGIDSDGIIQPKREGTVTFTLTVQYNGGPEISVNSDRITVSAEGAAAINIPSFSDQIKVEQNHDARVVWSTNVMDKYKEKAAEGGEPEEANFTVDFYKGNWELEELKDKKPEKTWEAPETAELINASSFQIPGELLDEISIGTTPSYTVKVSTENPDPNPNRETLTAVAHILVTSPAAVIKLDKNMGQFFIDDVGELPFEWTMEHFDATNQGEFEFKIEKNGEEIEVITFDAAKSEFDHSSVNEYGGTYYLSIDSVEGNDRAKDIYAVTLKAKNQSDSTWSYDSMYLQVYKKGAFQIQVDGKDMSSYEMSNIPQIKDMSSEDILGLNRKIYLSNKIGINNNAFSDLGAITDQFAWENSHDEIASIFYASGNTTDNIRNFNIETYQPKQQLTLGGIKDGETTITAEHANTGMKTQLDLTVQTLKDSLYLFQFYPKAKSTFTYTDGKGKEKEVETNDDGELALYDKNGIDSDVYVTSKYGDSTYTGVIDQSSLKSGENHPINGDLYPVNTLQLRKLAEVEVFFKKPDGKPYTGEVTYFGGVYKNGQFAEKTEIGGDGKTEQLDKDGKLQVIFDTTDFYSKEAGEKNAADLSAKDELSFMIEAHFEGDQYYPSLYTLDGDLSPVDMVEIGSKNAQLAENTGGHQSPFALYQYVRASDVESDRRDITDYKGRFGPSDQNPSIKLVTEMMWWGEEVDEEASVTLQNDLGANTEGQSYETFQYPFSKWHTTRHVQVLNKDTIWLDKGKTSAVHYKLYDEPGNFLQDVTASATLVNMIGVKRASSEELKSKLRDIKGQMTGVNGNVNTPDKADEYTRKTLDLLDNLNMVVGPMSIKVIPTHDPTVYKTFIEVNQEASNETDSDGFSANYLESSASFTPGPRDIKDFLNLNDTLRQNRAKPRLEKKPSFSFNGSYNGELKFNPDTGKWENIVYTGGFHASGEFSLKKNLNATVGPIPVTFSFTFGGGAAVESQLDILYDELPDLDWSDPDQEMVNDYLTSLRIEAYIEAFGGVGFDYSVIAAKIGVFGKLEVADTNTWLNREYLEDDKEQVKYGNELSLNSETGVRVVFKFLFVSYSSNLASIRYSDSWTFENWDNIKHYWETGRHEALTGENVGEATIAYMESIGLEPMQVINSQTLESRDYLKKYNRVWNASGQSVDGMNQVLAQRLGFQAVADNEPKELLRNAYPYSDPEVADDGSIAVYLSDGESTNVDDTVASWMVLEEGKYIDKDKIPFNVADEGYGDTNLHVAGEGNFIAATWVRQMEKIDKEAGDDLTNEDIILMNNSAEIMVSIYDGKKWETTQLTDNKSPDVAPVVSVNNGKVFVAYRSVSAGNIENPLDFSESDHIIYQVYDNDDNDPDWSEPETLYNGTRGHVMGLSTEMLSNGRTAVVYTLDQEDDDDAEVPDNQIVYSVVDTDKDTSVSSETWRTKGVIKNLQVTQNDNANENPKLTSTKLDEGERFILAWYMEAENEKGVPDSDIRLLAVDGEGDVDPNFVDSISDIKGASDVNIGANFTFSRNAEANKTLDNLSIIWKDAETDKDSEAVINRDTIHAVKFGKDSDGGLYLSGVLSLGTLPEETQADSISAYAEDDSGVRSVILGTTYTENKEATGGIDAVSNMYTLNSKYKNEFEVGTPYYNPEEIIPGFDLPIQFNVINQGKDGIEKVDIELDGKEINFDNAEHPPNESKAYTANYTVPGSVEDIDYKVTVHFEDESKSTSGTVKLDLPDVGISEVKVLKEEDGHRQLSIPIYNKSHAGLEGKKRTVKFGIYKDTVFDEEHLIGSIHDIFDDDSLQLIDQGGFTYLYDFDVSEYLRETLDKDEIPSSGLNVFVHAWIEDDEGKEIKELNSSNNNVKVAIDNLATKFNNDSVLLTTNLNNKNADSEATVTMQNMNMANIDSGNVLLNLLDKDGTVIESKYVATDASKLFSFDSEEIKRADVKFEKTGESVQARFFRESTEDMDATLSMVSVEGVSLNFDADKTEYTLNAEDLKETNIQAIASNRDATVTLTGENGETLSGSGSISFRQALERSKEGTPYHFGITVKPVGQSGETKTYSFELTNTQTDRPKLALQMEGEEKGGGIYKGKVKVRLPAYQVDGYDIEQAMFRINDEDWKTVNYDGTKEKHLTTLSDPGSYKISGKVKLKTRELDLVPVTLEIIGKPEFNFTDNHWDNTPYEVAITDGTDIESNVEYTEYRLNGGKWTKYQDPVKIDGSTVNNEGQVLIEARNVVKDIKGDINSITVGYDAEAPVITLKGDNPMKVEVGGSYKEPDAEVTDNYDKNIADKLKITGTVNTKKLGTYGITYTVTDSSNNTTSVKRTVEVVDTTKSEITLKKGIPVHVGDTYDEPGYTVKDNSGEDLTKEVQVSGSVDTNVAGTYTLTYRVEDSSGNSTTVKREVEVIGVKSLAISKKPTIMETGEAFRLQVMATFEDGVTTDVTKLATYESDNPDIITIEKNGNVKAQKAQIKPVTVTASFGKVTDRATLNVSDQYSQLGESTPVAAGQLFHLSNTDVFIKLPNNLPKGSTLTAHRVKAEVLALNQAGDMIQFDMHLPKGFEDYTGDYQLTMAVDKAADAAGIYYYNEKGKTWEYVGGTIEKGLITTMVPHFSTYGVFTDTQGPTDLNITIKDKTDKSLSMELSAKDPSGITEYRLLRVGKVIAKGPEKKVTDVGLGSGTTYEYTLVAIDQFGNQTEGTFKLSTKESDGNDELDGKPHDSGDHHENSNHAGDDNHSEDSTATDNLPKTNSGLYNWLVTGGVLFLVGICLLVLRSRLRNPRKRS